MVAIGWCDVGQGDVFTLCVSQRPGPSQSSDFRSIQAVGNVQ